MKSDGRTLYVNNISATVVSVFDLVSEQRIAQITAYSEKPHGPPPGQDGSFLYVADLWRQKINILDTTTSQITGEISGFSKICAFSVTRDGKTLLVVDSGAHSIAVADVSRRKANVSSRVLSLLAFRSPMITSLTSMSATA